MLVVGMAQSGVNGVGCNPLKSKRIILKYFKKQ